jgi:hypothetical protein
LIIAVFKKKKLETKNSCRDFSIGKIISWHKKKIRVRYYT